MALRGIEAHERGVGAGGAQVFRQLLLLFEREQDVGFDADDALRTEVAGSEVPPYSARSNQSEARERYR